MGLAKLECLSLAYLCTAASIPEWSTLRPPLLRQAPGPGFTHKYKISLKNLPEKKHSSLFHPAVSDKEKKFEKNDSRLTNGSTGATLSLESPQYVNC
jgi:hypothetical protein